MRKSAIFYLNGKRQEVSGAAAGMMLADFLRYEKSLTGTKIVCAEGDCGACSVLRFFPYSKEPSFYPINACITTVAQMDGSSLVTVDALAQEEKPSPVQEAMMNCHGSQCGFCTPGFVVALTGLVEKKACEKSSSINAQEAKNALTGNLCRCTGYQPIIDAALAINMKESESLRKRFLPAAQLKELKAVLAKGLHLDAGNFSFFAPVSLKEASAYRRKHKDARMVAASTDLGVQSNKRKIRLEKLLSLHLVKELYEVKKSPGQLKVGARVTLAELRRQLKGALPEFARFLDLFASPQIKNVATLVGNIGNASPIADTPLGLLALGATLEIIGSNGKRQLPLKDFYLGYRKTSLKPGEFLASVSFQLPAKSAKFALYKVSQRKDLDISAVNAAFYLSWADSKRSRVDEVRVALGGVAATPVRLPKTEARLMQGKLDAACRADALRIMQEEIQPLSDLRGSAAFRRVIAGSFLQKFFREHLEPVP